ncbi:flowering time control protein FCA-like [Pistacia vera]|uniref:flowering time control protein FCA-like n=1 Tax=Pistacia vera TaxID=55513 RepID=UPI001262D8BA|nr:flowering time control protein FCA-like [Pistacia vera]
MERHRGERFGDQPEANRNSHPGNCCSWFSDDHRPNLSDNHQHRRRYQQFDQMNGDPCHFFGGQPTPFSGRKRGFPHTDHVDGVIPAKLYVAPVSRTATEEDIRSLFGEHGNIVEVILPRDKRSGQQQGYCFVKYMTFEEADRAIRALNNQYIFPGEQAAIKVRYADGERERLVAPPDKLYVGSLSKQASKKEIEEIFSSYGHVEDIYVVRDEMRQSRGLSTFLICFMSSLNFKDSLILCFILPFSLSHSLSRGSYAFGSPSFGLNPQEPVRPAPNLGDSIGGHVAPNVSYPLLNMSTNSQPQAVSHLANQEAAALSVTQQLHSSLLQAPSQFSQVALQQVHPLQQSSQSSQQMVSEIQKELHPRHLLTQNLEQQQNSQVTRLEQSPRTGNTPQTSACTATVPAVPPSPHTEASLECDWSEHTCPDGYKYYYNCETCESKWDKPEEYVLYEQKLQKQQKLQNSSLLLTQEVDQTQEVQLQSHHFHQKIQLQQPSISASELDHLQVKSEASPVIDPTCV